MKDLEIKQEEEEDPVVTKRELQGFYAFGVATNPFAGVGLAVFFPILLESLAAAGGSYEVSNHTLPCNYTAKDYKCDVMLGPNSYVSLNSIVFYAIVISVAIQLVTYISFGSLADHGSYRKKLMYAFSYATAIFGICLLLVLKNSLWWISYILFILSGVTFGTSYVFYYAYVPLLTRSSEDVIKARGLVDRLTSFKISERVANEISGRGFAVSFAASFILLGICAGISIFLKAETFVSMGLPATYALQISIAFVCLVTILIHVFYGQRRMLTRPGKKLPEGQNFVAYSWKSTFGSLKKAKKLPELFKFLAGWFIFADGFSTIASSSILFTKQVLGASVTDLIIGAELANVGGVIGALFFPWLQKKLGWNCRAMIIMLCFLYALLPIYGLVAFNSIAEFWGSAFYHGLLLGASENACRVQFCELIPPGHEAEFFALYEIVDKGSAWIGPLAIGIINEKTGNFRNAFIFLLVFLLLPVIPFWFMKSEKGKHDAYEFVGLHEE